MNNDSRTILALMAFTGVFAVVGNLEKKDNTAGSDVKIFLGVGLGAVLLTLLAEAGGGAATFAKGLAVVALLSSILVNGESVFNGVDKLTGAKTTPTTTKGTT